MIFPIAGRGRPGKNHVPDVASRAAQEMLETAKWQTVSWRCGTKGKLSACFSAMRVLVADVPPHRIGHLGQQHLPGDEVWLVGEHRSTEERKYYLSNLPASRSWPAPSKPVESASRPISSSRKRSALITSRDDHGRDFTDTP